MGEKGSKNKIRSNLIRMKIILAGVRILLIFLSTDVSAIDREVQ